MNNVVSPPIHFTTLLRIMIQFDFISFKLKLSNKKNLITLTFEMRSTESRLTQKCECSLKIAKDKTDIFMISRQSSSLHTEKITSENFYKARRQVSKQSHRLVVWPFFFESFCMSVFCIRRKRIHIIERVVNCSFAKPKQACSLTFHMDSANFS